MSPRVLIIDDEPDWQETFKDIFVSSGFEADTVAGTGSAKELLETTAYRLLVFDIFLTPTQVPLNYQGFLTFMSPTYPRVKVVAATGKLLPPDEAFALRELGVAGFIYKPKMQLDELRGLVHRLLEVKEPGPTPIRLLERRLGHLEQLLQEGFQELG